MTSRVSILITGASGGIGRAAAIECANRGAAIGIHYHNDRNRAEATLAALAGEGHRLYQCDITDPQAAEQLIDAADQEFDGLGVLVNNAGISQRHHFEDIDYATWQDTWKRIVDTNLTGPANLCFCAAKKMIARGGGRIVNVSSRGAFRGEPLMPWYGASKAGMNAMGQSLAQALGPKGVFVYTVAPGFVETEMAAATLASAEGDSIRNQSSMGRVAQPEEIASTIGFLAFDAPEFMTGCIVDVNGASYLRS
ncbi:MAG: SDR family NAD(P)-dependent oxidoreductase [Gammaproteobacteria bacterium]|nr:SDR family NAD(P)-dependent oxidoreductase [Gammaproteobacteria bacterium]MCZ6882533.1 SDR family NAD(P)-dependent oxidoreductase [Gammaproteobacteria bacterium]